jgi:hypothetical protein
MPRRAFHVLAAAPLLPFVPGSAASADIAPSASTLFLQLIPGAAGLLLTLEVASQRIVGRRQRASQLPPPGRDAEPAH